MQQPLNLHALVRALIVTAVVSVSRARVRGRRADRLHQLGRHDAIGSTERLGRRPSPRHRESRC